MTSQRPLFLLLLLLSLVACTRRDTTAPPPLAAGTATLAPTVTPAATTGYSLDGEVAVPDTATTIPPTATVPPTATPDLQPAQRLLAGRAAERLGNWEEAEGWYNTLRSDRTYGAEAMFYAGDLYYRTDRYVEAAAAWTQGVALDDDGDFAAPMLYRLGRGLAEVGQHEGAVELYLRADELSDAADPVVAQRLAESYAAMDEMENAVAQWERLYDDPRTLRVNRALTAQQIGDWYAENEQWTEATTWYQAALEGSVVASYRAQLTYELGVFAEAAGESERAQAYWQAVLDEYPNEDAALSAVPRLETLGRVFTPLELGDLYVANEQYVNAATYYVTALAEPTHAAYGHAGLARTSEANGNLSGAIAEWTKIIETHPESVADYPEAWYESGRLQARRGETVAAYAAWQTVITEYPASDFAGEALWAWGNLAQAADDTTEAMTRWGTLINDYPDHSRRPAALWLMGQLQYSVGDYEEAAATFATLAEVDTRPTRATFWAGKATFAADDTAAAQTWWAQTIESAPQDYYALRAADLIAENAWSPRGDADLELPEASFTAEGEGLPADDPWLPQGDLLSRMGESQWAYQSYIAAVTAYANDPAALWEIALHLNEAGIYNAQSEAAKQVMNTLGYTIQDAPPDLLAYAYPLPYVVELADATADYDQDPLFVAAMIYQESRWQPRAQSSAAARGLLQVIPDTGRWVAMRLGDSDFTPSELYRPLVALQYGTYYLDYCLDLFDDNPYYALAAYNGGPGNAERWAAEDNDLFVENINYRETRSYVELVYTHWHAYVRAYRAP
jgi:soluble lytic murein transglycosylase